MIILKMNIGAMTLISGPEKSPYITYEFETGSEKYAWLSAAIGLI